MKKLLAIAAIGMATIAPAHSEVIRVVVSDGQAANAMSTMSATSNDKCVTALESGENICFKGRQQLARSMSISAASQPQNPFYVLEINTESTAEADLLNTLADTGWFKTVDADTLMKSAEALNDEYYFDQTYLYDDPTLPNALNFEAANDLAANTGDAVRVMVIDTGFFPVDYDMVYNEGYSFTDSGYAEIGTDFLTELSIEERPHGTNAASIIAAQRNNTDGIAGASDNVHLFAAKVGILGSAYSFAIANAVLYAAQELDTSAYPDLEPLAEPMDVINISMGTIKDDCSSFMVYAVNKALEKGIIVIGAAGNLTANAKDFYPASCDGVISIGASSEQSDLSSFSNYGDSISVVAQGEYIYALAPQGSTYSVMMNAGTSFSAPLIAGAAAIAKRVDKTINPAVVKFLMEMTARPLTDTLCATFGCGSGMLNATALTQQVIDLKTGDQPQITHALSDEDECTQDWFVTHFGDKAPLCSMYKVNFLNGLSSERNTFKLSKISKGTSFTAHVDDGTAEMPITILSTKEAETYINDLDADTYDYAYQFCSMQEGEMTCEPSYIALDTSLTALPKACAK
ncbi:S8 family peptidase [Shewanella youngdeokensis]|uniref:S8 family serine peptidase n=1 Tax=Shewanella youngdeokensis TaxID=2999068 RepID=A0ABZ0K244_9GAMM|nr:S8 family serine peptidase [Shewanella sp. DAU334]